MRLKGSKTLTETLSAVKQPPLPAILLSHFWGHYFTDLTGVEVDNPKQQIIQIIEPKFNFEMYNRIFFFFWLKMEIVVHECSPNAWDAEAGGSGVQGQPGLQSENISKKIYSCMLTYIA
jgi:hypothetical protein